MKLVNLTTHNVNELYTGKTYAPSNRVARVKTTTNVVDNVDGCPIVATDISAIIGLPEPVEGVTYIVSALVLNSASSRTDLVATGNVKRDDVTGRVLGCFGFRKE